MLVDINVFDNSAYDIPEAFVFHNSNANISGKVVYYQIYMLLFVQKEKLPDDFIYRLDLGVLK